MKQKKVNCHRNSTPKYKNTYDNILNISLGTMLLIELIVSAYSVLYPINFGSMVDNIGIGNTLPKILYEKINSNQQILGNVGYDAYGIGFSRFLMLNIFLKLIYSLYLTAIVVASDSLSVLTKKYNYWRIRTAFIFFTIIIFYLYMSGDFLDARDGDFYGFLRPGLATFLVGLGSVAIPFYFALSIGTFVKARGKSDV